VRFEPCDACEAATSICSNDCIWEEGECARQDCKPGELQQQACPCGGQRTRLCLEEGCWEPWTPCLTVDVECLVDDEDVSCSNGCGMGTCTDGCVEGCPDCVCLDLDGDHHCPGDEWTVVGGCGQGVDATRRCLQDCRTFDVCPQDDAN
jgi:hypothetical protein